MGFIPENVIDEILTRIDIVEFISRYVPMKKSGANHFGLCPFHQDKDPSFSANQEKALWKCFGCGLGGNIITFAQRREGLDFPDAVRFLAEAYQIPIPEVDGEKAGRTRKLFDVNKAAEEFFIKVLKSKYGRPFREYLKSRGFDIETIQSFGIGSSLPREMHDGLIKELTKQGLAVEDILTVGLARKGNYGPYDYFRGRLMIPIRDVLNRTIGFGARILADDGPKYLNSVESTVFHKGNILFGIDKAKTGIRSEGYILLMEGYTDVMRCHQHGLSNAVASMGTALTERQGSSLKRYSDEIIICFDADQAGQKAAVRSLPVLLALEMKPKVLLIPPGEDPDSILREKGVDAFRKLVDEASHFVEFLVMSATNGEVPSQVEEKIDAFREILPALDAVPNKNLKHEYFERVARALSMKQPDILWDIDLAVKRGVKDARQDENIKMRIKGESQIEREFITGLIHHPMMAVESRDELCPDDFTDPIHSQIFTIICDPGFPVESKDLSQQPEIYENSEVFKYVVDCIFTEVQREITDKGVRGALYKMIEGKLTIRNRMLEQRLQAGLGETEELQTEILENAAKIESLRGRRPG